MHNEDEVRISSREAFNQEIAGVILEIIPKIMGRIQEEMRNFGKWELTIAQLRIMSNISPEISTISDLADQNGVSPPAISKMVTLLETKDLVEKIFKKNDRRHVHVELTEKGKETLHFIQESVCNKIAADLNTLEKIEKEDISKSLRTLEKLYQFGMKGLR